MHINNHTYIFSASQDKAKERLKDAEATVKHLQSIIHDLDRKGERAKVRAPKKQYKKKKEFHKLDSDYKRKVTDPVINIMEKVCEERTISMLQLTGAILK